MTSRRQMLEYVNRADEDEHLESRVQVQRDFPQPIRLRALVKRGARREQPEPHECVYADMQALIDQGHLAYHEPWLTITPAGKAALVELDEA